MSIDTGGLAFPKGAASSSGMTLLDYYAGQAMPSVIDGAVRGVEAGLKFEGETSEEVHAAIARDAYLIARAMVNEKRRLEKGE